MQVFTQHQVVDGAIDVAVGGQLYTIDVTADDLNDAGKVSVVTHSWPQFIDGIEDVMVGGRFVQVEAY